MNILYKVPMYALDELRAFVSSFIPHFFSFFFSLPFFFSSSRNEDGRGGFFFWHERGRAFLFKKKSLTELASRKL